MTTQIHTFRRPDPPAAPGSPQIQDLGLTADTGPRSAQRLGPALAGTTGERPLGPIRSLGRGYRPPGKAGDRQEHKTQNPLSADSGPFLMYCVYCDF